MIWRCDLVPQYEAYQEKIHEAIQRVLRTGRYILASEVETFEKKFAAYLGVKHVVGVANGTDGLILSLKALGIGAGDEVITTPFTAIPTVSAIIAAGATPKFVDIRPDTFLIDLEQIAQAVTERTKAVMPVHIFGNVVDIPKLRSLVGKDLPVIEDACQAHGSTLHGKQAGSMGTTGVFSFYPTKNLGGYGDGGAVATNDDGIAATLKLLRMYGMVDKDTIVRHGINSRLDEMQAAILSVKLNYLDDMNNKRNVIADRYRRDLNPELFEQQHVPEGVRSNYHVFTARFRKNRQEFMRYLDKHAIQTNVYYVIPLHLQKANEFLQIRKGALPVAERLCDEAIALPMYPEMDSSVLETVIRAINTWCAA